MRSRHPLVSLSCLCSAACSIGGAPSPDTGQGAAVDAADVAGTADVAEARDGAVLFDARPAAVDVTDVPGSRCGPFDFRAVAAALQQSVDERAVDGVGLVIVRHGCETLFARAFGRQRVETVLELASASKVPAATLIMALVEQGKLTLDDKVAHHLPDWPADKAAITLRQLLAHTSGLPGNSLCLGNETTTLAACARQIAAAPLLGPPGGQFAYGGASYQVAGRVAEVVGGKAWNDLFRDLLVQPCAMEVLSYAAGPDNALGSDTNPRIAGGAAADLAGYAALLRLHLSAGMCGSRRVLGTGGVLEMRKDQTAGAPIRSSPFDDGRRYGLGFWHEPPATPGAPVTVFSDQGAFGATPWIDTTRDYAAFLLLRSNLATGTRLFKAVKPAIDAALER